MKLKTLISILTYNTTQGQNATVNSGLFEILWKDRDDLLKKIKNLYSSFEDTTDSMNSPENITDFIINEMSNKIQIYNKKEVPEIELLGKAPQDNLELIEVLKLIIDDRTKEENDKDGSFFIRLNNDELYNIFSLEEWRQMQLNKIV